MLRLRKLAAAGGVGLALTLIGTTTATADDVRIMASGSIKDPWASGDKIYASANLNGPNPVGTKVCVEIHAMHPYYPDINLGGTCKTINAGTVTTSVHKGACGNYKTYAYATYNGRVFWGPVESPRYQTICS